MKGYPPAEDFIPPRPTLAKLAAAAQGCTACDLYKRATQEDLRRVADRLAAVQV